MIILNWISNSVVDKLLFLINIEFVHYVYGIQDLSKDFSHIVQLIHHSIVLNPLLSIKVSAHKLNKILVYLQSLPHLYALTVELSSENLSHILLYHIYQMTFRLPFLNIVL